MPRTPVQYESMSETLAKSKQATQESQPTSEINTEINQPIAENQEEVQNNVESAPTEEPINTQINKDESEEISDEEALAALEEDDPEHSESEPEKPKHRSRNAEKRIGKLVKELNIVRGQLQAYQSITPNHPNAELTTDNQEINYIDSSLPDPTKYANGVDDLDYKLDVRDYQRELQRKANSFKEKVQSASQTYKDLPELIALNVKTPISPTVVKALYDSSVPVDLYYYLLKNPDVTSKLAKASPEMCAKEIGKIEAKLELLNEQKVTKKPETKPSNLPAPITPVKATKPTGTTTTKKYNYREY